MTKVAITGKATTRGLTVAVTAANLVPVTRDGLERRVILRLNTDKNDETGSPTGAEYA